MSGCLGFLESMSGALSFPHWYCSPDLLPRVVSQATFLHHILYHEVSTLEPPVKSPPLKHEPKLSSLSCEHQILCPVIIKVTTTMIISENIRFYSFKENFVLVEGDQGKQFLHITNFCCGFVGIHIKAGRVF